MTSTEVTRTVDPITTGVVAGVLASVVREMSIVVERTARSPVIALSHDYSNAVYRIGPDGPEMVVQGQDQPCHLGGMISSVKVAAERFADDLHEGDVIIGNDPWLNGTHLLDVDLIAPIFHDETLVGFAVSRAHHADIGGPVAGGYNPNAQEVYAEGVRIPPTKLVSKGQMREDVLELILANIRMPEMLRGDFGAQLSAVRVAGRRIKDLYAKYGLAEIDSAMEELVSRSERIMRKQVAAMPDGVYEGEQWIQEDGKGTGPQRIGCKVEVRGEEIFVTLDGPPMVHSYRNSYPFLTRGAVYFAILGALEPGTPINAGLYRAVHVDVGPPATMLNAVHPAACAMSTADVWTIVFDATCDALSKLQPERAVAGWTRPSLLQVSGIDPRTNAEYGSLMLIALLGGAGAVYGNDGGGLWGVVPTGGASQTGDVELLEVRMPLHFHQHQLATDSACPGRWRGAMGADLEFSVVGHTAQLAHVGDGTLFPPPSRLGGGSEHDAEHRVHLKALRQADGSLDEVRLHTIREVTPDTPIYVRLPGGGAVGDPFERDPQAVAHDVLLGFVSPDRARDEYGVVVDRNTGKVDETETAARRAAR